jgi:hypothetical protein
MKPRFGLVRGSKAAVMSQTGRIAALPEYFCCAENAVLKAEAFIPNFSPTSAVRQAGKRIF